MGSKPQSQWWSRWRRWKGERSHLKSSQSALCIRLANPYLEGGLEGFSAAWPGPAISSTISTSQHPQPKLPTHFNAALHLHTTLLPCPCTELLVPQQFQSHTALPRLPHLILLLSLLVTTCTNSAFWGSGCQHGEGHPPPLTFTLYFCFLFDSLRENFNCLRIPYQSQWFYSWFSC